MENYKIMSVNDEDLEKCSVTIRKAFANSAKKYGFTKENYPSSGAFITVDILKKSKSNGVFMYAAWVNGDIVGFVQLERKNLEVFSFQKFAVLPQYQQLGIGKALINICKNKVKVSGGSKMQLIMVDENDALKLMYQSNGFKVIGNKKDLAHPFLQAIMEMDIKKHEET